MEPQWDIKVELSDAEMLSFVCWSWWHLCGFSKLVLLGTLIGIAAITRGLAGIGAWMMVGLYLLESVLGFIMYARAYGQLRRIHEGQASQYHFDISGVSCTSACASFHYRWSVFTGIRVIGACWALHLRGSGFLPLPARVMTNDLLKFIRAHATRIPRRAACEACGYDLRGQVELRCPECGTPFKPEVLKL